MSRETEILHAAKPFFSKGFAPTLEVLGKVLELRDSMNVPKEQPELFSCGVRQSVDIEGMLNAIRGFCGEKERRMIDQILQIFAMRRMMDMMNRIQQAGENGDMWEVLKENLSAEQCEQIEMMQMMMTMMNTSEQE